jgi:RRNA methyltransferase AviRa
VSGQSAQGDVRASRQGGPDGGGAATRMRELEATCGVGPHFSPTFLAHGRLLYRFRGSDACRFSPKLAYGLLSGIAMGAASPPVLWDPFCGSGLIASIACLFFPREFRAVVVSDISHEAVKCARKNLLLVGDVRAASKRLQEMRGLQKRNAKSFRRWGEVAEYLEGLMPFIQANQQISPPVHAFTATAFELPVAIPGNVHFVGDLPYGRSSSMRGESRVDALLDRLTAAFPEAKMTFVMTAADAQHVRTRASGARLETRPCSNGRVILRASRTAGEEVMDRGLKATR